VRWAFVRRGEVRGAKGTRHNRRAQNRKEKEVSGQPTAEARAQARDVSRSRWGALAEQGEAAAGNRTPVRDALNLIRCKVFSDAPLHASSRLTVSSRRSDWRGHP
jgi:hypothetical protein